MAFDFTIEEMEISGVYTITMSDFRDERGELWSGCTAELARSLGIQSFEHQKFAYNKKSALRGIHGDHKTWKLVTCLSGEIQQVCVDNRKSSETFKKYISLIMSGATKKFILIPPGVGNAFKTLSDSSLYSYSLSYRGEYADADEQFTLKYDDIDLNIEWLGDDPLLSSRDS